MFYLPKVQLSKFKCLVFYLLKVQLSKLNTCGFIFQKTNFPSSTLDVLSSKSSTFQAQYLWFYLLKVQLSKLNTWCFIFQKSNFSSSNAWCFIFQKTNLPSSILGVLSSKSPTFQAQYLVFYLPKVQLSKLNT